MFAAYPYSIETAAAIHYRSLLEQAAQQQRAKASDRSSRQARPQGVIKLFGSLRRPAIARP